MRALFLWRPGVHETLRDVRLDVLAGFGKDGSHEIAIADGDHAAVLISVPQAHVHELIDKLQLALEMLKRQPHDPVVHEYGEYPPPGAQRVSTTTPFQTERDPLLRPHEIPCGYGAISVRTDGSLFVETDEYNVGVLPPEQAIELARHLLRINGVKP